MSDVKKRKRYQRRVVLIAVLPAAVILTMVVLALGGGKLSPEKVFVSMSVFVGFVAVCWIILPKGPLSIVAMVGTGAIAAVCVSMQTRYIENFWVRPFWVVVGVYTPALTAGRLTWEIKE